MVNAGVQKANLTADVKFVGELLKLVGIFVLGNR